MAVFFFFCFKKKTHFFGKFGLQNTQNGQLKHNLYAYTILNIQNSIFKFIFLCFTQ